jgi:hypothetical protein
MKKIISLLSVFAMIATLFTTVAFADDNNKFYIEESVDGTNVTLTLYMTTNQTITAASGTHDLTAAYAACDSIDYKQSDATVYSINATQKVLSWSIADVNGVTGTVELGTVTFTNVKSDFSLPQKRNFTAKDDTKTNVIASFTNEAAGYTVKAPKTEDELPADRTAAVKFAADENTFVEITKGAEVKNYFLPSNVKGDATVYGLLKYTVDGTNVASGDIFTIKAVDMETKAATDVATITVE